MGDLRARLTKIVLRTVAVLYLAGIWIDGAGIPAPGGRGSLTAWILPKPLDYFLYVAALFPVASTAASEYRAEAWVCEDKQWREIDVRPYFRVHADDKESRFQRALYFYHDNAPTKAALDQYLVDAHAAGTADDGIPAGKKLGGVRFVKVHIPIPPPGSIERYRRIPLPEVAPDDKNVFYRTPGNVLRARCGEAAAGGEGEGGAE